MTDKQMAVQDIVRTLLARFFVAREYSPIRAALQKLRGFDRKVTLRAVYWAALEKADWELAEFCLSEGYPIAADPADASDGGALHDAIASLGDRPDVIAWLIDHGANVDQRGINDDTPLIAAARRGFDGSVRVLLSRGAQINLAPAIDDGLTALMAAASRGHSSTVEILLAAGADRRAKSRYGLDAAAIAGVKGHDDVARRIREIKGDGHGSQ
jgi:hypothetical protein